MRYIDDTVVMKRMKSRLKVNKFWKAIFFIATSLALLALVILLIRILSQGMSYLNWDFSITLVLDLQEKLELRLH